MILGGIEAGGTKFIYGLSDENGNIIDKRSCSTTTPDETLPILIEYFKQYRIDALGIGCFGPIDLNPSSSTYGYITSTPKLAWQNFDILGAFKKEFSIPITFDTDVNGAVLGEMTWGVAKDTDSAIYITVGTGIGGGAVVQQELVHGLLHPEMGHILISKHPEDSFNGVCPFHDSCLEALASGPSIEKRWNRKAHELPIDHRAWKFEAYYLAQAIMNFTLIMSPQKIILGGGVMKQAHLFPMIRKEFSKLLNNYIQVPQIQNDLDHYIVPPGLGDNAGFLGSIALALKNFN